MRYRCHGGGPALGALDGAVNASPPPRARRPPDAVARGEPLERRWIGDAPRRAFEDQVERLEADRDRARRIRLEVAGLLRARPTDDIDVAVVEDGADPRGVRPAVRADGAEEIPRVPAGRPRGQQVVYAAPLQGRVAVGVQVLGLDELAVGHVLQTGAPPGSHRYRQFSSSSPSATSRTCRAGTPITNARAGTSFVTTAP